MKKWAAVLLCCLTVTALQAQGIVGRVTNSQSQPLPFANVVLLNPIDSTFLQGAVTTDSGTFAIPTDRGGGLLRVSLVGYTTRFVNCTGHDAGTIVLQADTLSLAEVIVKGSVPTHRLTDEGLLTTVENTLLARLGTGEDVLKNIPGLVKKSDGFEVFGKGTPLIYINGRQMRDQSELDQLRAQDIRSVEVISNPCARYSANITCIVKIRTKRPQGEGLGFNWRSSYFQSENTDVTEQLNWNYRREKLDVFGTFAYYLTNSHFVSTNITEVSADTLWNQRFSQNSHEQTQTFHAIVGTNYTFDDDNSMGLRYTLTAVPVQKARAQAFFDVSANGAYYDHIDNSVWNRTHHRPQHLLNAYYRGRLGKLGIDLNADLMQTQNTKRADYDELSQNYEDRTVTTANYLNNRLMAAKLVLDYPVLGGTLTGGAEGSHVRRRDEYTNVEQYVPNSYARLEEAHLATFVEYARQTPIGRVAAGLRYEWVNFDYYENNIRRDEQSRSFGNLFPSLSLGTKAGPVQLQLAYSAKTRRPSYSLLSTNVSYGNRFLLQSGNPLLRHEYRHNVSLSAVWKFMQAAVAYSDRRHAIIYWAEQTEENPAVSRVTYQNYPSLKSLSAQVVVAPTIGIWQPQLSAAAVRQWLTLHTATDDHRLTKPIFQLSLNNNLDLGRGWTASLDGWMQTKGHYENNYICRAKGAVEVSVGKSFFGDRLSLRLQGSDIFFTQKDGTQMYTDRMHLEQRSLFDSREFAVTLRYNFNATRNKYQGTGAGSDEKNRL